MIRRQRHVGQVEGDGPILPGRGNAVQAQAQRGRVAGHRQADRLAGQALHLSLQQRLHGKRRAVPTAVTAAGVAGTELAVGFACGGLILKLHGARRCPFPAIRPGSTGEARRDRLR